MTVQKLGNRMRLTGFLMVVFAVSLAWLTLDTAVSGGGFWLWLLFFVVAGFCFFVGSFGWVLLAAGKGVRSLQPLRPARPEAPIRPAEDDSLEVPVVDHGSQPDDQN